MSIFLVSQMVDQFVKVRRLFVLCHRSLVNLESLVLKGLEEAVKLVPRGVLLSCGHERIRWASQLHRVFSKSVQSVLVFTVVWNGVRDFSSAEGKLSFSTQSRPRG